MATIEERAKEKQLHYEKCKGSVFPPFELGYRVGAVEQREIDADIICDLMISMLNDGIIETIDIGKVNMRIRKIIGV